MSKVEKKIEYTVSSGTVRVSHELNSDDLFIQERDPDDTQFRNHALFNVNSLDSLIQALNDLKAEITEAKNV